MRCLMKHAVLSYLLSAALLFVCSFGQSLAMASENRDSVWQWSVPLEGMGLSSETNDYPRAFLYIPPEAKHLRGVLIGQHNMLEEPILEHKAVRAGLADAGMAAIWVSPQFQGSFNFTEHPDGPVTFQEMLNKLADVSGYDELSKVPVVWIGHSAMANAPYHFAAWDLKTHGTAARRCAAGISVKGYFPTHKETDPDYSDADLAGVPILYIEGEYADAHGRAGSFLKIRNATPGSIFSFLADVGGGHFDWNNNICEYIGMYLRKLGEFRLPERVDAKDGGVLKTIDPANQGWLAERWHKDKPAESQPADVATYAGDAKQAFWYFDKEHAKETFQRQSAKRAKRQLLAYTQNGSLLEQRETHFQVQPAFLPCPDGDGLTFQLGTTFLDSVPAVSTRLSGWTGLPVGTPLGHSSKSPVVIERICGPVEKISENTFRIAFDRVGLNNRIKQWRSRDICLQAVHPGDEEYAGAVQQALIRIPLPLTTGAPQLITFPEIPDQSSSTKSISLAATTTAAESFPEAKVGFYVREGPAKIEGNQLVFTPIPCRAKFPVKVTVVAWQYGRTIDPKLRTAEPVERTFHILAPSTHESWLENSEASAGPPQACHSPHLPLSRVLKDQCHCNHSMNHAN